MGGRPSSVGSMAGFGSRHGMHAPGGGGGSHSVPHSRANSRPSSRDSLSQAGPGGGGGLDPRLMASQIPIPTDLSSVEGGHGGLNRTI
eukprot:SAG22_NODE_17623_length_301_cov_1.376238_1_plen_87_part_10